MNDRFKFKFWHKPTKKMVECYGYNSEFVFGDTLDGIGTEYNPAKFEDCILMQSTGLKDKNGTLIYEGDIVTYEWLTPIGKVWRKDGKHIVKWNDGYTVLSNIAKYDVEHGTTRNVEVIGNIYENKELLE